MMMRLIIDGNNLAHAYAEVAGPTIGRQHLCELVGQWAARTAASVLIVFDGPPPPPGVRQQMERTGLDIRFSEARTADDVIEDIIQAADSPASLCVVTSDRALASAGRHRRCRSVKSQEFVRLLTAPAPAPRSDRPPPPEKPGPPAPEETDEWLRRFQIPTTDPDDLTDLMR